MLKKFASHLLLKSDLTQSVTKLSERALVSPPRLPALYSGFHAPA